MSRGRNISLGQAAADLAGPKVQAEWRSSWSTALYRWPAVPVVWVSARLGISPLTISLIGLLLAVSMPLQALMLPIEMAVWAVALSGASFQILDCADGTLARVTGRASKVGGDVDFLIDMAQWGLLYTALGILADTMLGGGWGYTALTAIAAWGRLLARVIRDTLSPGTEPQESGPLRIIDFPVVFVTGISGLIPFLALSGAWLGWGVIALLAYSLLDIGDALLPIGRALRGEPVSGDPG